MASPSEGESEVSELKAKAKRSELKGSEVKLTQVKSVVRVAYLPCPLH